MSTKITIASDAIEPVSLEALKTQLREDLSASDQDEVMGIYLPAAREAAEAHRNELYLRATCKLYLPCFFPCIELEKRPFVSLTSVEYYDADNALQTLSDYELNDKGLFALVIVDSKPVTYKRHDAVVITYQAGYEATDVPAKVKQGILLTCANWYKDREIGQVPQGAKMLWDMDRIYTFR